MKKLTLFMGLALALCACSPKYYLYDAKNAIVDKDVYAEQYALNKAEWDAVFAWLSKPETKELPAGRYQVTKDTYATVQIDRTKPVVGNYEDHHQRIDLFYTVSGAEKILVSKPEDLRDLVNPYSEAKDVEHYKTSVKYHEEVVTPGKYIILFPSDAHAPMIDPDGKGAPIHKIVCKIPFVKK